MAMRASGSAAGSRIVGAKRPTVAIAAPAGAGRAVIEAVVGVAVNAVTVPFAAVGLYRLVGALRERASEPVSGA